mmetsp:Transcript_15889/g.36641  ORF Transcript_15889/g.36641 Transcript_15889/m.36641 type:complete len:295 (+) Transcript_15889:196-1080(+)
MASIDKLVLLHSMGSSSESLRSKRAANQRKLKLKQEMEREKAARGRVISRVPVQTPRSTSLGTVGTVDSDDNVIPKPPSSSSLSASRTPRFRGRSLSSMERLELLRRPQINVTKTGSFTDPILSVGSSSSIDGERVLPSQHIRSLFQRAPSVERGTGTGRDKVKECIEARQAKLSQTEVKDEVEEETRDEEPLDLRSIYQRYLAGQMEKECVVRSGTEWTTRYKDKRREQAHKKMRQASGNIRDGPSQENAKEKTRTMISRRYQRRGLIPLNEMPADQQQSQPLEVTRRSRYSL